MPKYYTAICLSMWWELKFRCPFVRFCVRSYAIRFLLRFNHTVDVVVVEVRTWWLCVPLKSFVSAQSHMRSVLIHLQTDLIAKYYLMLVRMAIQISHTQIFKWYFSEKISTAWQHTHTQMEIGRIHFGFDYIGSHIFGITSMWNDGNSVWSIRIF